MTIGGLPDGGTEPMYPLTGEAEKLELKSTKLEFSSESVTPMSLPLKYAGASAPPVTWNWKSKLSTPEPPLAWEPNFSIWPVSSVPE